MYVNDSTLEAADRRQPPRNRRARVWLRLWAEMGHSTGLNDEFRGGAVG
jgi:hypothetical protein